MLVCLSTSPTAPTRTPHYSPLLHVTILLCGSHLVDDPLVASDSTRGILLEVAHKYLLVEGDRPSLSTIKGALMLGQYYTAERLLGLGYVYTGMAMRFSHMRTCRNRMEFGLTIVGLSLPKESSLLGSQEEEDRNHMHWSLQLYDK
jgi:hypothetical protein